MLLKLALRNLLRNKRRTLALLLTVGVGCGSLFLYHGFNYGIMNQYKENTIRSRYADGQLNTSGYREKVFEKPWEQWIANFTDIQNALKSDPRVEYVFPRVQFFAMLSNGKINVSAKGQGIDANSEAAFFSALNIVEGKNLTSEEDGIILGKGLAHALDVHPGDRVTVLGQTVFGSLNGVDLTVVGVFHTGVQDFDDVVFRLPIIPAQKLLDTDKVESISIGLAKHEDSFWKSFATDITKKFSNLEATGFAVLDEVYYQHSVDFLKAQFDTIKIVILVIVIMGIMNMASTSILERKQEIGTLRANGESWQDVMRLLIAEGLVLGVVGAVIGIVVAIFINNTLLMNGIYMPAAPGITRRFHVFVELQASYAFFIFLFGILTTFIGVALAGLRVVRMPIAELLRSY